MAEPTLKQLMSVATEAAYLAGRRTLAYFNTGIEVETKADDTPVTRADREAETVIRQLVGRYYPDHAVLGEEQGATAGHPDYRWIIDPIDGTKSFIHGVPMYGVLIGVEVRGVTSVGAVYIPALDEMVCAALGHGCTWNGRPARVSTVTSLSQSTLLCGSPVSAMRRSDAFDQLAGIAKLTRGWGDCYGHILVATGRAEVMIDAAMNPWDCGPLLPILKEAGGHFSDWSGKETIWGPDAVSTNAAIHAEVMTILQNETRR